MSARPSPAARIWFAALAAGLLLLLAAATAGPAYLPTHDGPQHVFASHAANHLDAPGTGWALWLEPNLPPTSHGFAAVFEPLDAFLPWPIALRAALAVIVLVWAGGAIALARAAHPERAWLGLALAAAACQWSLWMGLFNFLAAAGFGLWVLALAVGARRWTASVRALLALLLFVQALLHVVPAAMTGALVALLGLARAAPRERGRELLRTAALGAPALAVALALASAGLGTLGDYNQVGGGSSDAVATPWWTLGKCFVAGPAWRAWPLTVLAATAVPIAWLRRRDLSPEDRALAIGGALLLAAGAALPLHVRAWDFLSVRFLPLGAAALVVSLPVEALPAPRRRAFAAVLSGFAFAASGWAFAYGRELSARAAPALAGLDAPVQRAGLRLPVVLDPYLGRPFDESQAPVPYAVPLLNLGQLYTTAQGGVVPYAFMFNPHLHSVLMRQAMRELAPLAVDRRYAIDLARPGRTQDVSLRRAVLAYVAGTATDYDDVILYGRDADVDELVELGFRPDFRRGGLALARFAGCPLEVRIASDAPLPDGGVLEVGWLPAWHVTHRYALARAQPAGDGTRVLKLRQSCGGVWLGFAGGELRCRGADAAGRLSVASTRAEPVVTCRVEAPAVAAR
jgi:hypothetical protein